MRRLSLVILAFVAAAVVPASPSRAQDYREEVRTFTVQARPFWQDTGVVVGRHPVVIRVTEGLWTANPATGMVGPGGTPQFIGKPGYALAGEPEGMLIGRIGKHVFPVGAGSSIPPELRGKLELVINDDLQGRYGNGFNDNQGALTVVITTLKPIPKKKK